MVTWLTMPEAYMVTQLNKFRPYRAAYMVTQLNSVLYMSHRLRAAADCLRGTVRAFRRVLCSPRRPSASAFLALPSAAPSLSRPNGG